MLVPVAEAARQLRLVLGTPGLAAGRAPAWLPQRIRFGQWVPQAPVEPESRQDRTDTATGRLAPQHRRRRRRLGCGTPPGLAGQPKEGDGHGSSEEPGASTPDDGLVDHGPRHGITSAWSGLGFNARQRRAPHRNQAQRCADMEGDAWRRHRPKAAQDQQRMRWRALTPGQRKDASSSVLR